VFDPNQGAINKDVETDSVLALKKNKKEPIAYFSITSGVGNIYGKYGLGLSCEIGEKIDVDINMGIFKWPNLALSLRYVGKLDHFPLSFEPGITIGYRTKRSFIYEYGWAHRYISLNFLIKGYITRSLFLSNTIGIEKVLHDNSYKPDDLTHIGFGIGYTVNGSPGYGKTRKFMNFVNIPLFIESTLILLFIQQMLSFLSID
jgi:hypothetical protein